jgi:hypothetical protein
MARPKSASRSRSGRDRSFSAVTQAGIRCRFDGAEEQVLSFRLCGEQLCRAKR